MIYLISLCAFVLIMLILNRLMLLLTSRERHMKRRMNEVLGQPVQQFTDDSGYEGAARSRQLSWRERVPLQDLAKNNKSLEEMQQKLSRAGIPLKVEEYLGIMAFSGLFGIALGLYLFHVLWMALVIGLVGLLLPFAWVNYCYRQRIARIENQLLDVVVMMASSLRAGHSFMQAMELVARETQPPLATELQRVLRETRVGVTLEDALEGLLQRVESSELELLVSGVLIQRQVGGNLAEILDTIANTLEKRVKMRGRIRVLTAQGRISTWVIAIIPFVLAFVVFGSHPEMGAVLLQEPIGVFMLVMSAIMLVAGIYLIRKVVNIDA
ncbi:MAG: type II secretion system F family protein [Syntrophomonadaceae bacterium]